ncbi:hypothetical protein OE88DRAFT_1652566 [Heliocybe sulcata]|uniref:Uncharacterized protein n=1 Tax=Heliocybe sulcata TaxID=5364 RepID=A0A5C3NQM5_9AGAM|nr:hypothetical protein OE88DRAFT_1652566 [Heliocybe sulcata]
MSWSSTSYTRCSSPPPMSSPKYLPTPLPSPPPFHRKSSSSSLRKLQFELSDPPIPPRLIGSPLLNKTLPPRRTRRSAEDLSYSQKSSVGLGKGFVDAYEFGVGEPPASDQYVRKSPRRRPGALPLSAPSTPSSRASSPRRPLGNSRSPCLAFAVSPRSPPLTPIISSPPPPVPPIPVFLLEPGDIVTKPVLRPVRVNRIEEHKVEQVGIPDLELEMDLGEDAISYARKRSEVKENRPREEPMTCSKFLSLKNGSYMVTA